MIKNELIKFFTPLKTSIYGGVILIFILISDVIFADKSSEVVTFHNFLGSNMGFLVFVLPIILAPIVSEVFTYDYECGCMKFFIIYKKREKVLFYKILALIIITGLFVIFAYSVLIGVYIIKNTGQINILKDQMPETIKMMVMFLITLIPVLLIYVLISIMYKNSAIVSLLVFLFIIMSDFFPKVIGNITPRRFLWDCLLKKQIDKFSIILFLLYIVVFILLNVKLFNKKEMVH